MQGRSKFTPKAAGRFCLLFALLVGSVLSPVSTSGDHDRVTDPLPPGFDGEYYADLVVGVPDENVGADYDAGNVHVLYFTRTSWGSTVTREEFWDQGSPDIYGTREAFDKFGAALAVGDFDGDGFLDLAVGVPDEEVGTVDWAGAINVIYGGPGGLSATGNQYWTQNHDYVDDDAEAEDRFGSTLAAGDFDGDGCDDLAVGVPYESIGAAGNAGAVHVFYGSIVGLSPLQHRPDKVWSQNSPDIEGNGAGSEDCFGSALAVGNFNGDGYDDLAVGVIGEAWSGRAGAGGVNILYGGSSGLSADGNKFLAQYGGHGGEPGAYDRMGWSLAAGDFDGDGNDELAVGVPFDDVYGTSVVDGGSVKIWKGYPWGLGDYELLWLHQNSAGIGSLVEEGDRFGEVLTTGDFNADGLEDLAIGLPHEDWNDPDTGIVQVLYGSRVDLLLRTPDTLIRLGTMGQTEVEGDQFGAALAAGEFGFDPDFPGDPCAELVIGAPYRDLGWPYHDPPVENAGVVHILFGCTPELGDSSRIVFQGPPSYEGVAEVGDHFGAVLAAYPGAIHPVYLPLVLRNW